MSEIALPLYAHITTGKLVTKEGSSFTLPEAKLGDTWVASIHFLEDGDNEVVEKKLKVTGLKAQIGPIMAPPTSGKFKLLVNAEVKGPLGFDLDDKAMLTALGEGVPSVFKADDGCWIVRFTNQSWTVEAADNAVADYNTLSP